MPIDQNNPLNMGASDIRQPAMGTDTPSNQKILSFGEQLVGLTFNPSGDPKVNRAKQLCADLADLIYEDRKNREVTQLEQILYPHTIGEILNTQMNVVKLLTLKY